VRSEVAKLAAHESKITHRNDGPESTVHKAVQTPLRQARISPPASYKAPHTLVQ